jgi:hypothetical protein
MKLTKWREGSVDKCLEELDTLITYRNNWRSLDLTQKGQVLECMLTKTKLAKPSTLSTFMGMCNIFIDSLVTSPQWLHFGYHPDDLLNCIYDRVLNYELEDDFISDPEPIEMGGYNVVKWTTTRKKTK